MRCCRGCENNWRNLKSDFSVEPLCRSHALSRSAYSCYLPSMRVRRVFPMIARSSSSESRRHGTPCAATCGYLSERMAEIGFLWLDRSQFCLAKTDSHGAQGLPDKMSRVFGSKSAMAARLRVYSKSVRFSDTIRTCLREVTIHTIKSLRQTFGAMTRAHRITIGIS